MGHDVTGDISLLIRECIRCGVPLQDLRPLRRLMCTKHMGVGRLRIPLPLHVSFDYPCELILCEMNSAVVQSDATSNGLLWKNVLQPLTCPWMTLSTLHMTLAGMGPSGCNFFALVWCGSDVNRLYGVYGHANRKCSRGLTTVSRIQLSLDHRMVLSFLPGQNMLYTYA